MKYKKIVIFMMLFFFISLGIFVLKNKGLDIATKSNKGKDKCTATIRNKEEHSFENKQLGEAEINQQKREEIVEKYGLDTPPKNEGNISVDLGISGELKEICLFKEGKKEVSISEEKAIDEFLQVLNMEEWKAVVNWNLKIQPSKYIKLGDDIILGIIEDGDKTYIKLDGEMIDGESNPYRYYEVKGRVVQYFNKYVN